MIRRPSRNDPCPCGSGRKYKKCCQARRQQEDRRARAAISAQERRNEAISKALAWLNRHHGDALEAALEEFGREIVVGGRDLSEDEGEYLQMQAVEWALAEGTTHVHGRSVRLRDLVLEGGLILDAEQRLWLERATEEPMRLCKIIRTQPGEGLELQDILVESAEPIWVKERSASRSLRRSEVIAARLARWQETWELATLYAIPSSEVLNLVAELEKLPGDPAEAETARRIGRVIRDFFVHLFTRTRHMPELVSHSGEPIELTTDHWQILDEAELERRLAAEADVVGSREQGWAKLEDVEDSMSRNLLAINPGQRPDRLETFASTRKKAEHGRAWLEKVAGPSLRFLTREIVDPTSEAFQADLQSKAARTPQADGRETAASPAASAAPLSPREKTRMVREVYERQYAGIEQEKVPILGDKSPRELLEQPGGRRKLQLWLEGFEAHENKMAEADGREPVDMGFLWEKIGLER